ncbi:MAG: AlbA family DNA-binding domain-containing protein [Gammaproteobacteria bacterium]
MTGKLTPAELDRLLDTLPEDLTVECKPFLDLSKEAVKADFIKTCIALRNQNGGFLILGVRNTPRQLVTPHPEWLLDQYTDDKIRQLISTHVSDPFDIGLYRHKRANSIYPIIEIPSGVKIPISATKDISGDNNSSSEKRLKARMVYVRTLKTNGTPSTAEATSKDWGDLMDRCVANRETDIAGFLRRNFSPKALQLYRAAIGSLLTDGSDVAVLSHPISHSILNEGRAMYVERVSKPLNGTSSVNIPRHGSMEASLYLPNVRPGIIADRTFLQCIKLAAVYQHDAPMWDTSGRIEDAPYQIENSYEAFRVHLGTSYIAESVEFWKAKPSNWFYHYRSFLEDFGVIAPLDKLPPGSAFAFEWQACKVAHVIFTGLNLWNQFHGDGHQPHLDFAFRWNNLNGRQLFLMGNRFELLPLDVCRTNTVESQVYVPVDTAPTAVAQYVYEAVRGVYASFGGFTVPQERIERVVTTAFRLGGR